LKLETGHSAFGTRHFGHSPVSRPLIGLIRIYQWAVSPLLGPCCRFHPNCSSYCIEAIETYGLRKGLWLGTKRLLKCHPLHPGGFDPVPTMDLP
jgi:uncharacterized protein